MTTHIAIVLDRSGSMQTMASEAADSINTLMETLNDIKGKKSITINQFDNYFSTTCKEVNLKGVPKLVVGSNYVPRGTTALYDAIGKTIGELTGKRNVMIFVMTDGVENASKEFTHESVKKLIDEKIKLGWKFEFLASDLNAEIATIGLNLGLNTTVFKESAMGYASRSAYMGATISDYMNSK